MQAPLAMAALVHTYTIWKRCLKFFHIKDIYQKFGQLKYFFTDGACSSFIPLTM
jgi:hypothetical protein